jgi:ferredoxin--NADP+ reductase
VGYLGVPLPGVPFNDRGGVILNEKGRVIDPQTKQPVTGQYVSGWIKRGPSGVIGTNKPDSVETANGMIEDLGKGALIGPTDPDPVSTDKLIHERQPQLFSFADWRALDKIEVARGLAKGRPRIKFTSVQEMLAALGR